MLEKLQGYSMPEYTLRAIHGISCHHGGHTSILLSRTLLCEVNTTIFSLYPWFDISEAVQSRIIAVVELRLMRWKL